MDEAETVDAVKAGETEAFGGIVEHYQQPIVRYLVRLTGDHQVALDLAQDTFLLAYRNIAKTRSEVSLKAWLYRIATNNALQWHRRRRMLRFIPLVEAWGHARSTPDFSHRIDEKVMIEKALLKVPHAQRVCMVLHFVEGFKYREIAEIVGGVSEEAVRKRVARGSDTFREAYLCISGGEVK